MKIHSYPSENEALQQSIKQLNNCLSKVSQGPVLLLLSGGSSLQIIDGIEAKNLTNHMTITVLDERYSTDEKVSNFAQIAHTAFYRMLTEHGSEVIDTRLHHDESKEDLEQRWETKLRGWRKEYPNGKIIATLGMGEDGHIAGIMPYDHEVDFFKKNFQSGKWVTSYDAKDKNPFPLRVTCTMTFLKMIDCGVMYVVGENKKQALDNAIREKGNIHTCPARIIHDMKDVHIYTDQT